MTLGAIQDQVDIAKLYYLQETAAEIVKLKAGYGDIKRLNQLKRLIRSLTYQVNAEVNNDTTLALFKCLMRIIGNFSASYIPDPSVQVPGGGSISGGSGFDVPIPTNSNGFYDYPGNFATTAEAFIQLYTASPSPGWITIGFARVLDNGHIYAEGDFSADTYRLLINP